MPRSLLGEPPPPATDEACGYVQHVLSRRQLITGALTVPVALAAAVEQADARQVKPFLVHDETVREFGNVVYIGDSTSNGSRSDLRLQLSNNTTLGPYRFDIGPGRSMVDNGATMYSGTEAVRRSRAEGQFTPAAFVVALGANDLKYGFRDRKHGDALFDRFMTEVGPDCTVCFTNMYATVPSKAPRFNRYLGYAVQRWPNLYVVDWAKTARRHPRWHKPDGFHMNLTGSRYRNTFILNSMVEAVKLHAQRTAG